MREVVKGIGFEIELFEIGALDGLSSEEVQGLMGQDDEGVIVTDYCGEWVTLSKAALTERMAGLIEQIPLAGQPLVVVMSTGLMGNFHSRLPTVNAQRALESAIWALSEEGEAVGLIMPLEQQVSKDFILALAALDLQRTWAQTEDEMGLKRAAQELHACEIVVLNSVSYTEKDAAIVREATGKRVILASRAIASAIRLLLSTRKVSTDFAPEIAAKIELLTPRERQVLPLMGEGLSSKLIARQLGISPKTVEIHRTNIMRKFDLRNSRELIYMVAKLGAV